MNKQKEELKDRTGVLEECHGTINSQNGCKNDCPYCDSKRSFIRHGWPIEDFPKGKACATIDVSWFGGTNKRPRGLTNNQITLCYGSNHDF